MSVEFLNFSKSKDTINFDVKNCNSSFVNCLRRTILSSIRVCGFRTEEYEDSDLKVIENTSSLHNEFLLHRLGLIPINIVDVDTEDISKYKFILKVENKTQQPINITSKDIKVINLESQKEEDTEKFFPKSEITGDFILITRLKPTPDGLGESIHIEGKCSIGTGKEHVRFSPVSNVCFINKVDPKIYESNLNDYIIKNENLSKEKATKKFDIEESERCFHIDSDGNPNVFEFTIESCGIHPPPNILISGLKEMLNKILMFQNEFEKALTSNESMVDIKESSCLMKAFDINIKNENHTLGHLLQSYINHFFKDKNIFVGYMNPHPLEEKIILRIKVEDLNQLKTIIATTLKNLTLMCKNLIESVAKVFKLKGNPSIKKKFKVIKPKVGKDKKSEVGAPAP